MNKTIAILGAIATLAFAGAPAHAVTKVVPIGTLPPAKPYFYITDQAPDFSTVAATFGDTVLGAGVSFDDIFTFTLPFNGTGSGSASTSFSGPKTLLTILGVEINGVDYTAAQAAAGINMVPIKAGFLNSIEVFGITGPNNARGTFSGSATFEAAAVPEPATWATFLIGFGFMGLGLRRKLAAKLQTV